MIAKSKLSRDDVIGTLRSHKPFLKKRFGVVAISLYGSFARDEATEASDIDLLVDFEEIPNWHRFYGTQRYIESIFERPVDLARPGNLRKEIQLNVERDLTKV